MDYVIDKKEKIVYVLDELIDSSLEDSLENQLGEGYQHRYTIIYQTRDEFYNGSGIGTLHAFIDIVTDDMDVLQKIYRCLYKNYRLKNTSIQWIDPSEKNQLMKSWGMFSTGYIEDDSYAYGEMEDGALLNLPESLKKECSEYAIMLDGDGFIRLNRLITNEKGFQVKKPKSVLIVFQKNGKAVYDDGSYRGKGTWLEEVALKDFSFKSDFVDAIKHYNDKRAIAWKTPRLPMPISINKVTVTKEIIQLRTEQRNKLLKTIDEIKDYCKDKRYTTLAEMHKTKDIDDIAWKNGYTWNNLIKAISETFDVTAGIYFSSIGVLHEKDLDLIEQQKEKNRIFKEEFYENCIQQIKSHYTGEDCSDSVSIFKEYFTYREKGFEAIADKMENVTKNEPDYKKPLVLSRGDASFQPGFTALEGYLKEKYDQTLKAFLVSVGAVSDKSAAEIRACNQPLIEEFHERCIVFLKDKFSGKNHFSSIEHYKRSEWLEYMLKIQYWPEYWGRVYYKGHSLSGESFDKYIKRKYKMEIEDFLISIGVLPRPKTREEIEAELEEECRKWRKELADKQPESVYWIAGENDYTYKCSFCGCHSFSDFRTCEMCGAKMTGCEKNGEFHPFPAKKKKDK